MKLSDKIVWLRKSNGMSQDELAEKLNVSRQAVSRWENSSTMPDAANILQLSKLFCVTTDYLLHDEYESDNDLPKIKEARANGFHQIMFFLVALEVIVLLIQFMTTVILGNAFFGILSFLLFGALVGGFEYAYRKKEGKRNKRTPQFRKQLYQISAWLGTYFPTRLGITILIQFFPRPFDTLVLECVILAVYIMTALLLSLELEKRNQPNQ